MRRTYISPEFDYTPQYGTYVMAESPTFFGSKMMDIEDSLDITDENLIYNQLLTGEQLDEASESNLPQIIYDSTINKLFNHSLEIQVNQTPFDLENSAKWIFKIEIEDILRNHIFALLKKNRTFEGIKRTFLPNGDIDSAIFSYINKNILNRYGLNEKLAVDLFIDYIDLCGDGTLQYKNEYDKFIESDGTKVKKIATQVSADNKILTINFSQEKPAYNFSFKYYFNLYFVKL
jgi:hypothetical protein